MKDEDRETAENEDDLTPPAAPQTPEEEEEALRRKIAEIERKVADGN
ncbi:hypothetical protein M5G20_25280 [Pseudomonas sp. TNT2022 ID1044]|nr:hypothetical protein [Pseudomonas sp. TNT2022 ID1044]MDD0999156.1 hypothetical protein [Pseudomonas sp. TNT2022 ID1044]